MNRRNFMKTTLGAAALCAVPGVAAAASNDLFAQTALGTYYGKDRTVGWGGSVEGRFMGFCTLNTWQRASRDRWNTERGEHLLEALTRDPHLPRRLVFQHDTSELDSWSYFPEFQVRWWSDRFEGGRRVMGQSAQVFWDVIVHETPWTLEISTPGGLLPGMTPEQVRWAAKERAKFR